MKSLTNAVLSVATALNRIATALETKSTIQPKKLEVPPKELPATTTTTTTTPSSSVFYYSDSYSTVHITRQEKDALDRIYNSIKDTGINPKHHNKIMADIAKKWPTLNSALVALVAAKSQADKERLHKQSNKYSKEIWNHKNDYRDARKWNR